MLGVRVCFSFGVFSRQTPQTEAVEPLVVFLERTYIHTVPMAADDTTNPEVVAMSTEEEAPLHPPNQTLYVSNLNNKLKQVELKKCLLCIFSPFGTILDIVAMNNYRLRGQAWVVFAQTEQATLALSKMQGFPFFDMPMRISYAKAKSDAVRKLEGTFVARTPEQMKEHREMEKRKSEEVRASKAVAKQARREEEVLEKKRKAEEERIAAAMNEEAPPHNILFVQNLPAATTDKMLRPLFSQFPGFQEVRMVEARPGIAFVEFDHERRAGAALAGLQNFKITPENAMKIAYAKR